MNITHNQYFYNDTNFSVEQNDVIKFIDGYSKKYKKQYFAISTPLLCSEDYDYEIPGFLILTPGCKILAIKKNNVSDNIFDEYLSDIKSDISTLSSKFDFTKIIGRERNWKDLIIESEKTDADNLMDFFESRGKLYGEKQRSADIIIALLLGSINDAKKVGDGVPIDLLDRVKRKIMIFDSDQTRFIYQDVDKTKRIIKIQGLSGTGKTELLLHKLKDLYVREPDAKIAFTCYNRVLAESLKKRIPTFFNFSKVDRQIEWNEKLWCFNAWGRSSNPNSGALRYICYFYGIVFQGYGIQPSFEKACASALDNIKQINGTKTNGYAFTYFFIDESQDFSNGFVKLIDYVTEKRVYLAGDTFQTIFDHRLNTIKSEDGTVATPDYVLNRCYRTAPMTFMFAHAMGMGLFEKKKLSWMPDESWIDCGYVVEKSDASHINLTREPLRRFDDDTDGTESFKIVETSNVISEILSIIGNLREKHNSISPNDIAIVFLDDAQYIYNYSVVLKDQIYQNYNWKSNLAYESKVTDDESIFITNRNNVKGLEFPFVLCITTKISRDVHYRNSLYTMLTRSFLESYLILSKANNGFTDSMRRGASQIKTEGRMTLTIPSEDELIDIDQVAKEWKVNNKILSLRERIEKLLNEAGRSMDNFNRVHEFIKDQDDVSDEKIRQVISIL